MFSLQPVMCFFNNLLSFKNWEKGRVLQSGASSVPLPILFWGGNQVLWKGDLAEIVPPDHRRAFLPQEIGGYQQARVPFEVSCCVPYCIPGLVNVGLKNSFSNAYFTRSEVWWSLFSWQQIYLMPLIFSRLPAVCLKTGCWGFFPPPSEFWSFRNVSWIRAFVFPVTRTWNKKQSVIRICCTL